MKIGDKVFINRWGIDNACDMGYDHHGLVEGMTGVVTAVASNSNLTVAWDHPTKVEATRIRPLAVGRVVNTTATPVTVASEASKGTTLTAVTRFVGAYVAGLRFGREGDVVTVYNDGNGVAEMTITQLREVMAILEGVA